ncbi:MAG: response regulator [Chloroflexi bacterium]|nr:response regulator [Chloroflexota bacterium]
MNDIYNQTEPSPTKILVVDDEESVCTMVSETLELQGFQVSMAHDGNEALSQIRGQSFHLIVSDIRMPGMDGLALLKETMRVSPATLMIIMTGHADMHYVLEALRNGAAGFLVKPFSIAELRTAIQTALQRKQNEDELVRLQTLTHVSEISRELVRTLDLKMLTQLVVNIAAQEANAKRTSLMLTDRTGRELSIAAATGLPAEVVSATRVKLGEGIAGYVAETGQVLVINEGDDLEPWLQERLHLPDAGSALSVPLVSLPLVSDGKPLGVLNLSRAKGAPRFSESDINLLSILTDQATTAIRNAQLFQQVRDLYLRTIQSIAMAIQAKDPYTHGHSDKVADYTLSLSQTLGLGPEEIENLYTAALLHDIGKIGVREEVLHKPGPLTPEEYEHVKTHPLVAEQILRPISELGDIVDCIKHEHENWDGSGYPSGLRGEEIPRGARIIAVVDAFHAMTSDRPYRKAMSVEQALDILRNGAGRQWDPRVVAAWLEIVDEVVGQP